MSQKLLIVDDDQSLCELLRDALKKRGYEVEFTTSGEEAASMATKGVFDVVISDVNLDDISGLELCERIAINRPDVPVVVITAFGSMETAIAAIRAGAYDFITKPVEMDTLALTVGRAVQHKELREEVKRLKEEVQAGRRVVELIGNSPSMRETYDMIQQVGTSDASVLITGESGTGKELVARALHKQSSHAEGPFVAINCAAMPMNLLESELFGHTRGAFTDAKSSRQGLFIQADSGTLFLDEIGELPLEMQPKLLRAIQERKVRPIGGTNEVSFNTRIISATNRDLEEEVDSGRFREDLFYRINVVRIKVPPLRSRGNDVLLLAQHFVDRLRTRTGKHVRGISAGAARKLLEYDWPGNVRELENSIERAVALTRFEEITVEDLPEKIRDYQSTQIVIGGNDPEEFPTLEEVERRYIRRVLKAAGGNKTQTARILGMDRRTLYRRLDRLDLNEGS